MRLTTYAIFSLMLSYSLLASPIGDVMCAKQPRLIELKAAILKDRNPGYVNKYGESYLHIAAKRNMGNAIEVLMTLPQIQALFWAQNRKKQTAIEVAIVGNKENAFGALLPFMGDPNRFRIDNKHPWTHLHLAAYYNRGAMARALVKAGHAANPVDKTGWSPLDTALHKNAQNAAKVLRQNGGRSTKPDHELAKQIGEVDDHVIVHDVPAHNQHSPRAEGAAIFPQQPNHARDEDEDFDEVYGADIFQPEMRVMAALCATVGAAALFPKLCSLL